MYTGQSSVYGALGKLPQSQEVSTPQGTEPSDGWSLKSDRRAELMLCGVIHGRPAKQMTWAAFRRWLSGSCHRAFLPCSIPETSSGTCCSSYCPSQEVSEETAASASGICGGHHRLRGAAAQVPADSWSCQPVLRDSRALTGASGWKLATACLAFIQATKSTDLQ